MASPLLSMRTISCGVWLLLSLASTYRVAGLTEHKVHNIVLYPDKHSWCKTTEIKQIVAYPGCSSIEIDNNVCVGACFSYSIPRTIPSAPGEVIIPYCDSCQPVDFEWREVTLTCSDESGEEEGQTEMTKRVQVITNCSCTSCEKQYEEKKASDHHRHIGSKSSDDVPELMSLMMGVHHTQPQGKDSEEEEEVTEDGNDVVPDKDTENAIKEDDKDNLIDVDDDGDDDDEEEEKKPKTKPDKESRTLEILHLKKHANASAADFIEIGKSEHKHYRPGPHHSLVLKPDEEERPTAVEVQQEKRSRERGGEEKEEEEETPSLLMNQFKIHDNEDYLDQIAVESIAKEVHEKKVLSVPDMIYNASSKEEKWRGGVRMLEVPHHHLQPAVEGVELSYFGKNEPKEKLRDEE